MPSFLTGTGAGSPRVRSLSARRLAAVGILVSFGALAGVACSGGVTATGPGATEGVGLGGTCDLTKTCRTGLTCDDTGKCIASGTTANGGSCVIGVECISGDCGPARTCDPAGSGAKGDACLGDADCAKGLRCGFDGTSFFAKCVDAGTLDVGGTCTTSADCLQGLYCETGKCAQASVSSQQAPHGVPPYIPSAGDQPWTGVKCPAPSTTSPVHALFHVPRVGDAPDGDFFKLPYPNDAARDASGKVSFDNFPHDAKSPLGFDVVKRYLDAVAAEPFSAYPTMTFRFEGHFDFADLKLDGADPQTRFVDITPGASTFGGARGLNVVYGTGGNRYLCGDNVSIRPNTGDPLRAGGVYAAILKRPMHRPGPASGGDGSEILPSPDFTALIAATEPGDSTLKAAYAAYKPLRDYLASAKIDPATVLVATVFTVGDPSKVAKLLRPSVRAAPAPAASNWVKCGAGAISPCPDATGNRACTGGSADFDEYHAIVSLPIFQQGSAPYLTLADGGAMSVPTDGSPIAPVRTELVCAALTVPKGTAPAGGWPVAIYAHGTGGSFRSHVDDGSAKALSSIDLGGGTKVQFATLGIDQVSHGPRRGSSPESKTSPNDLFFNFANPAAARFNALQGAADQHTLVRFVEGAGTITVGADAIKLDGSKIVFWGHSQGATEGAMFLAFDASVKGAILSGEGGGLIDSLVTKTSPVNIRDMLYLPLEESGPKAVSAYHPVLGLLQQWIDPADPIHFARLSYAPTLPMGTFHRNVFQPFGFNDTYAPSQTQLAFAFAAYLPLIKPIIDPDLKITAVDFVQGNVAAAGGAGAATAAFRQYAPSGTDDGHFVVFKNDQARTDAMKVLARSARGELPKIPE
jgi:hypothetical protein